MTTLRNVLIGTATVAALFISSSAGLAQGTSEQRAACKRDAFQFCAAEIPNVSRITACMKANLSKLSEGCRAVMSKG
jgi:hypothetical protein